MNAQEAIKAMFEGKLICHKDGVYKKYGLQKTEDGNICFIKYYENMSPSISGVLTLDLNDPYIVVEEK